jgi:predicted permease
MKWWQVWKRQADIQRELESDLALEEEEHRAKGLSGKDAYYAARRSFGNTTLIQERVHEAWGWAPIERLSQDARYALRQLWRSPGFSAIAIATLAFGIGATTSIFTLVYDVLLRPLQFAQPTQIVTLEEKVAEWSNLYPTVPVSANHFTFWEQHNRAFDSMAIMEQTMVPVGASGRPFQVGALWATPGIFSVLRVQPVLGRAFTVDDTQTKKMRVVVLTYEFWREQFDSDPAVLTKAISVNGFPYSVIGVMPESFHMPAMHGMDTIGGTSRRQPIGILLPLVFTEKRLAEEMGDLNYFGIARLKPGTSIAVANAELDSLQHTISMNLPAGEKATLSAVVSPFQEKLIGSNRKPLMILLAAVAGLLLVGCVNITNLLLSRAVSQKRQMAVAAALGARRTELIRMAIRETAMLALLGGGLGLLLAAGIVPAMRRYLPPALDFRGPLHLDWVGAGCAILLVVLATLAAGAAPALMVSRTAPQEILHSDSHLASESLQSRRARRVLIALEAAVSVALVLTTGLLIASLTKLMSVDRGFTTDRIVTATVDLPSNSYRDDQQRAAFYREVLDRMNSLPGVEHAAFASVLPLMGDGWGDMARVVGDSRPATKLPLESVRSVSPQYFAALDLRLITGITFNEGDWGKNLALISERTAKSLWPEKDPLGQHFTLQNSVNGRPFTVIGVVKDARTVSLAKPDPMLIYVPYWYRCEGAPGLLIRTRQDPSEMANLIRQTIWSVDSGVPVPTVRALGAIVVDSVASRRFELDLLLFFAVSAVLLAGLGVYGVLTYAVSQRYREMGLRIALGAPRTTIYLLVLRDGLMPVAIGAAAGIALAFGSAHIVSSLLFHVSPYDPILSAGAVAVLLAVAAVACLLPAHRAAATDPMQSLRTE